MALDQAESTTLAQKELKEKPNVKVGMDGELHEEKLNLADMDVKTISYKEFKDLIDNNNVKTIYFSQTKDHIYFLDNDENIYKTANPNYELFQKEMLEEGIELKSFSDLTYQADNAVINRVMASVVLGLLVVGLIFILLKEEQSKNMALFGQTNGRFGKVKDDYNGNKSQISKKTFNDIAGLKEVKKDLNSIVDFLKNKDKYKKAGAKLPKGIILYGPPGTGKTLISKAISGEANVNFLQASGSDFIEMYVGVGPKRIRELFQKAKNKAPCIIFIDEIDAIGGKRSPNENSEDRKTINALLTEMDGFSETENILVIGATNRIEDLDPALLRPGRFTNKFCVPLPESPEERMEVINLYSKNKKFTEDVDFKALSKETIGFSPAQIESLLNESAIISVQDNKKFIDKESIDKAMFKMLLHGHAKENQSSRDKEELKLVAWHESGHALIGKLNGKEVSKVTIISSTSGAGGVTFSTPKKMGLNSVEDLKDEVRELYGGRAAEFILYGDKNKVTTGASNDIDRATNIIKEIVTKYGMNEKFGLLNLENLNLDKQMVLEEEIKLAKELENDTIKILTENKDKLEQIANALLEKETIYEKDLDSIIFNGGKENLEN